MFASSLHFSLQLDFRFDNFLSLGAFDADELAAAPRGDDGVAAAAVVDTFMLVFFFLLDRCGELLVVFLRPCPAAPLLPLTPHHDELSVELNCSASLRSSSRFASSAASIFWRASTTSL